MFNTDGVIFVSDGLPIVNIFKKTSYIGREEVAAYQGSLVVVYQMFLALETGKYTERSFFTQ